MKRSALYEGRHSAQRDIKIYNYKGKALLLEVLFSPLVVAEYQVSQASQLIWAHWPRIGGHHGCTGKMLAFYSNVGRSHQKMVKAKSARYKHGHCYLKVNLGRRCGKTEIVCHWSFLMLLAPAQQSIQLLICHRSRWWLLFIRCH